MIMSRSCESGVGVLRHNGKQIIIMWRSHNNPNLLFGPGLADTGLLIGGKVAQDTASAELGFEFYARAL